MFKRCFSCLLPPCTREAEASQSVAFGFYTGAVYEVGDQILILELDVEKGPRVLYLVPRKDRRGVKPGHAVYFLKEPDREILTIPALLPFDECLCTIYSATSSHLVLIDSASQTLVFPCTHTFPSSQRLQPRHALLVRAPDEQLFEVVVEGQNKPKKKPQSRLEHLDSSVLMTLPDDSVQPSLGQSPGKKYALPEEESDLEESCSKRNFSFSSPFAAKEDEHQSSSILTLEGDSGGEGPDVQQLALPDIGTGSCEESSKKRFSAFKQSSKLLIRIQVSPYPPEETLNSIVAQPECMGRDRLPLHLLKQPSMSDRQIEIISGKAAAWRCAGPGASSFFWCIAVAWLEHLARAVTGLGDLDAVIASVLQPTVSSFEIRAGFEQHCEATLKILQDLRAWKEQNRTSALVRLQCVFQQKEAMVNLEKYLRMICMNYLEKLASTPELSRIVTQNVRQEALSLSSSDSDVSNLTFMAVSDSLNLSLCLLCAEEDNSVSAEEYRTEDATGRLSAVMLLQQEMHFHLLYSREDQAVDGYDMDSHCFEVLQDARSD